MLTQSFLVSFSNGKYVVISYLPVSGTEIKESVEVMVLLVLSSDVTVSIKRET